MPRATGILFTSALTAGLALVGCGKNKVTQCNALVQVLNTGAQSLEKAEKSSADPESAASLRAVADAMEKTAADAEKAPVSLPELKKYSADYQAMAREVAKSAREMADAAEKKDSEKVAQANAALEKAAKQEEPIIEGLNKFCQAP